MENKVGDGIEEDSGGGGGCGTVLDICIPHRGPWDQIQLPFQIQLLANVPGR